MMLDIKGSIQKKYMVTSTVMLIACLLRYSLIEWIAVTINFTPICSIKLQCKRHAISITEDLHSNQRAVNDAEYKRKNPKKKYGDVYWYAYSRTSSYWTAMSSFLFWQVTRVGAVTWDPNYILAVDFLDNDFS